MVIGTDSRERAQPCLAQVIQNGARQALPELFVQPHPAALYYLRDRHGISVTAVYTRDLTARQLRQLLGWRFAQYVAAGFVDSETVYAAGWEYEPPSFVNPDDLHLIAGSADSGEMLGYAVLTAPPSVRSGVAFRDRCRPLYPVEDLFGWGVFNRLPVIPDLQVCKVREVKRFVKNDFVSGNDERAARAPVEVLLALVYVVTGPLFTDLHALIGDLEEGVVDRNLAFFHCPMMVLHTTPPNVEPTHYLRKHFEEHVVYPFAILVNEEVKACIATRVEAIEQALELPGKKGILALLALRRDAGYIAQTAAMATMDRGT